MTLKQTMEAFNTHCDEILETNEPMLNKASKGISLCNQTLTTLKEIVHKRDFNSVAEEIDFFKNKKTIPMSWLIFFTEVRACELRMPKVGTSFKVQFLQKELRKVNKFFCKNADFVHYIEQGYTHLDDRFFTRNHRNNFPYTPMTDYYQFPEFATAQDMLCAKVKAMERFIQYIRTSLKRLKVDESDIFEENKNRVIVWTGPKTALTELIYALFSNGTINNGAADINLITESFEDFFNIKLDNIYKTYSEIKARKCSKTKFLEELTLNLQQKMAREDID